MPNTRESKHIAAWLPLAMKSCPRPRIAVSVLFEKSTFSYMAVTKIDLDPKVRKISITF